MSVVHMPSPAFGPEATLRFDTPHGPPMKAPSIGLVSGFRKGSPHGRGRKACLAGYQSPGFQYHSRKFCDSFQTLPTSYRNLSIQNGRRISSQPYGGGGI